MHLIRVEKSSHMPEKRLEDFREFACTSANSLTVGLHPKP
jgi:hypothetical protein